MTFILFIEVAYTLMVAAVIAKVIMDTDDSVKAAAYILLVIVVPVVGIGVYFTVGLNYRKKSLYSRKLLLNKSQSEEVKLFIAAYRHQGNVSLEDSFPHFHKINRLFPHVPLCFATQVNEITLLKNGEEKFPELLKSLKAARHHIHLEYYIYESDNIGHAVADVLIQKAKEGVQVRFIYDDFGSRSIHKSIVPRLRENGVKVFPFYKFKLFRVANRLNYRNHRKIVIIDGETAFVGGINISDKYDNSRQNKLYWRDAHIKIQGEAIWSLQNIFIADWNFCSGENLGVDASFFKRHFTISSRQWTQVVSSGPDFERPDVLHGYLQAIESATENIFITTPYFIPPKEILTSLKMAAISGVDVRLLVPGISDSYIVNAVSKSYFEDMLVCGVKIYLYEKGFIHAKTIVCDQQLAIIGTTNLDHRSFELNFEVNAILYDHLIAERLKHLFFDDLKFAKELDAEKWMQRSKLARLLEKTIRLFGPLM
ncbi:MAG: cardiolipin synthase [Bacteroidetes bacterium]|nr:cardiolipin synthase [Bacteroidota bacterium]